MSRERVFAAAALLLSIAIVFGFLDVLLRLRPTLFGHHLGNYVFSRYGFGAGDIYFGVPELGVNLMWPEMETQAYYNGLWWTHRTDARGFRNPPGRESDVVLVGDSLIYGHGAESEALLTQLLNADYGWRAYDLSQQGDGLYNAYVKLRLYMEALAPRVVVYFAFANDVFDLDVQRPPEQIESAPELRRDDWDALREAIAERGRQGPPTMRFRGSPAMRFFGALASELGARRTQATNEAPLPPFEQAILDDEGYARAQRYYDRAFADLARRAEAVGARFVVVHLDVQATLRPDVRARFRRLVESAAAASGVPYYDTGEAIRSCPDCVLENDGHLNARGHAVLAEQVDGWLREVHPDPPERG